MTAVVDLFAPVLFDTMKEELPEYQKELKNVNAIILYEILKNGQSAGKWTMDLKVTPAQVYEGEPRDGAKANVTVTMEDQIFIALAAGEMDAVKAFMTGKVKAKGNIMLMQKLNTVMQNARKRAMI